MVLERSAEETNSKMYDFSMFLQVMSRLDCWGLDVFKVSDLSQERPLTVTTYTIFQVIFIQDAI